MAIVNINVYPYVSPRIIEIPAPATEVSVQDLLDSIRNWEDSEFGQYFPKLIDAAGKEDLGGGVSVGITAELQNARVAFQQRPVWDSDGTATTANAAGQVLVDSAATFITDGIISGDTILNKTDNSSATVISVDSETQITHFALEGGTDNDWDLNDEYLIWNNIQCNISGGNLVAVDDVGGQLNPILPTAFVYSTKTSSSSATLADIEAIEYASFDDQVTISTSGVPGTTGLIGSKQLPVDNIVDALTIAVDRGFTKLHFKGNWTFPNGTLVIGYTIEGDGAQVATFTFDTGAIFLNCLVQNVTCTGDITGIIGFKNCDLRDIGSSNPAPNSQSILIESCFLEGDLFLPPNYSGTLTMLNCHSREDVTGPPVFNLGGSSAEVFCTNYTGEFSIINGTANNKVIIEFIAGRATLESSVTNGQYTIRGVGSFVNNSSIVPNTNGLVDARDIKNVRVAIETLRAHHTGYGNVFYWDPINGNDTNDGKSEETAVLTFAQAHTLAEDGNHDVIIGVAGQSGGQTVADEVLNITKNYLFVRGPGRDFKIKPTSTTAPTVTIDAVGVEVSSFVVETAATGLQHGVHIKDGADFAYLSNMWIHYTTDDGVRIDGSNVYSRIEDTFMSHLGKDGIHLEGEVRHVKLNNVEIDDPTDHGIHITGTTPRNNIFTNEVKVYAAGGYGLKIESGGLRNYVGHGVHFYDNGLGGIDDQGSKTFIADELELEEMVDAIWDESSAAHTTLDTYGEILKTMYQFAGMDISNPLTLEDDSKTVSTKELSVVCNPDGSVTIQRIS